MHDLLREWLDVMLFELDPTNLTWIENVVKGYMFIVTTIQEGKNDNSYVELGFLLFELSNF